jgi:hypothetical protein
MEFSLARELNQQINNLMNLEYNVVVGMVHRLTQYLDNKGKQNGFGN